MFVDFEEPTKPSRFQVTRSRDEIEVPISVPEEKYNDTVSSSGTSSPSTNTGETVTPTTVTPSYFMSFNDYYGDNGSSPGGGGPDSVEKSHQATASSGTSYYNTIYKYNKMKNTLGDSLEHRYFPLVRRYPLPNSNNAQISFYADRIHVYNFLQRPTGFWAIVYHVFVSIFIISCLVLTIVSTSKGLLQYYSVKFFIFQYFSSP